MMIVVNVKVNSTSAFWYPVSFNEYFNLPTIHDYSEQWLSFPEFKDNLAQVDFSIIMGSK